MKRAIAFLLALVTAFVLCGCGSDKKAFEISKEAYNAIKEAYEVIYDYSDDVYEIWRICEFDKDEILSNGLYCFEDETGFDKDLIIEALCRTQYLSNYDELSDDEKNEAVENVEYFFTHNENYGQLSGYCVWSLKKAYELSGKTQIVETQLEKAKTQMKLLTEDYSDYEYYPKLKELFVAASALFDFCENPTGSFNQYKILENDYKNTIRDCMKDLEFIFE